VEARLAEQLGSDVSDARAILSRAFRSGLVRLVRNDDVMMYEAVMGTTA